MAGNLNTNKQVTNSQFINLCCYIEDLPAVNRMFQHDLNKFGPGVDAPMWQKERFYEEWLEMDFSIPNWKRACRPSRNSSVPKDFYSQGTYSIRSYQIA